MRAVADFAEGKRNDRGAAPRASAQTPSLAVGDMLRQSNFLVFPPTLVKIRRVLL